MSLFVRDVGDLNRIFVNWQTNPGRVTRNTAYHKPHLRVTGTHPVFLFPWSIEGIERKIEKLR